MYPVIILREEFVCLVILVFIYGLAHTYNMGKDSKVVSRLVIFAIIHVLLDAATVITVNNLDSVPTLVNDALHILFYLSAIVYAREILLYSVRLCFPDYPEKLDLITNLLPVAYAISLPFLPIEFVAANGTNSSAGPAAVVGYTIAFILFVSAIVIIIINYRRLPKTVTISLLPMMVVLILSEIGQMIFRELLFTGGAVTIVTVGFFVSLENPVKVMQQKAMTDALTGVLSRHGYQQDMELFEKEYEESPSDKYTFVFCDINNLRGVNNHYGHQEGDRYITMAASAISKSLKSAKSIYRMGGDEFMALYVSVSEDKVKKEIENLHKCMATESSKVEYTTGISVGYAVSSSDGSSLNDVINTADYIMYRNKEAAKAGPVNIGPIAGTKLNLTGLTDRFFDAMCVSNDRTYPYICNLDTNITRISPSWVEFFGLPGEFISDFGPAWIEHIHPEDRAGFMGDYAATLNGKQQYHNYEYRAKGKNGHYVHCSCHGAVYRGEKEKGIPDIFTGYMINHGVDELIDSITGLGSFAAVSDYYAGLIASKKPFIIYKLKLINITRINMLYGYEGGNEVLRGAAELLKREIGSKGQVFSSNASFTYFLTDTDRTEAERLYRRISDEFLAGINTSEGVIPITLAAGAICAPAGCSETESQVRSRLIYALDESVNYRRNMPVYYDEIDASKDDFGHKYLARLHQDAVTNRDSFFLRYQEIHDTITGKTTGAEALIRWKHPDFGEIPPDLFIGFIESESCYYDLGLHLIRKAVSQAKRMTEKLPTFKVNINITSVQLSNEGFADAVEKILRDEDFPASQLVLELTERCKELEEDTLANCIAQLRSRGIQVAFDDAGTGYTTINLLINIPVDVIKLDRRFVSHLPDNSDYCFFVEALVKSADRRGFQVCYEGVENEHTLEFLQTLGPSSCQGFYFSQPLEADELYNRL